MARWGPLVLLVVAVLAAAVVLPAPRLGRDASWLGEAVMVAAVAGLILSRLNK